MNGKPADKSAMPSWMPRKLGLSLARAAIKKTIGNMEDYGLPKPDHEPLSAHPSVSGEFLTRAGCGDIKFKPAIKAFEGHNIRFDDDSVEHVDAVIFATGYKISFPFLTDPAFKTDADNRLPLFKRMVPAGVDNLFYMGLAQPLPTLVNFAEQQAKLLGAYLAGRYHLPSATERAETTAKDEAFYLGGYYNSPRHTIQVDFGHYCSDLTKEITRGTARAKAAGWTLPVPARVQATVGT
jgi:cation diffusion facilitator CzcD-associated flavoprotein CzcO